MITLSDAFSRKWAETKSEFDTFCHSGPHPDIDARIATILDAIVGLVRTLGHKELAAIHRSCESSGQSSSDPAMTTDLAAVNPGITTELPPSAAADITAAPDGIGAINDGFEVGSPLHFHDAQTETYVSAHSQFDPTQSKPASTPSGKPRRKVPTVPGYQITGVLGHGGMGIVYRATQTGLKREVALKMILAGEHANPSHLARFTAEAQAVARIHHPNIVQIYEIGEHEGVPYFSLELCTGSSLDRMTRHEPQPPRDAARMIEKLARGVAAAHAAGVIHRDLKPANVLLDADGTPKITDFGVARAIDAIESQTQSGSIVGTPNYMSPEQALGRTHELGPRSDQYSLGATLYELITGRPPFQGATTLETLDQVRKREPVPPTQLQPDCPRDLETICLKVLSKEPEKRYATCEALAEDLRAFLDGRPITARPTGTFEKAWRWAKRNPRVAGLASLVAILLVLIAGGGATAATMFRIQANNLASALGKAEANLELAVRNEQTAKANEKQANINLALANANEKKATDHLALAHDNLLGVADEIPMALQRAIFARGAEQKVLELLGAMLEKQMKVESAGGLQDRALLNYHLRMGELSTLGGKLPEAEKQFLAARKISERLLKTDERQKDKAKANHALVLRSLGSITLKLRRSAPAALKLYGEAMKLQQEVIDHPETGEIPLVEAKQSLAATLHDIADVHRRTLQFDKALSTCEQSLLLSNEVVKLPATSYTTSARQQLAETQVLLGRIQTRRGQDADAVKALTEAATTYRSMHEKDPTNVVIQIAAARSYRELGDFLLMRNRLKDAAPYYDSDLEITHGLLQTPEILAAQNELSDAYYRSATLLLKTGKRVESEKLYRRCLDSRVSVAEARSDDENMMIRVANAQARCGLHVAATQTADRLLAKSTGKPNPYLLMEVMIYSICSDTVTSGRADNQLTPDEKALRQKYADRAIQLLEQVVSGYRIDAVKLNTDPDLDAIRLDPRFQAIVRKLEKALPKK